MIQKEIKNSAAEWHILVTHYPPHFFFGMNNGVPGKQITDMDNDYGIDLIITGHTHYQDTSDVGVDGKYQDGGIRWILTGGGGGVTTDNAPQPGGDDPAYGFIDFTVNRTHLKYDMVTWTGKHWTGKVNPSESTLSRIIESKKAKKKRGLTSAQAMSEVV